MQLHVLQHKSSQSKHSSVDADLAENRNSFEENRESRHSSPTSTMQSDSLLTLKLPEGYTFSDLKLRRCDDDAIDLDMDLVKLICNINSLNFEKVCQTPGPVVTSILTVWYKSHIADGGKPDALMEELKSQQPRSN